jgi:hypothetical protein
MSLILVPPTWKSFTGGQATFPAADGILYDVLVDFAARAPEGKRRLLDPDGEIHRYLAIFVDGDRIPFEKLKGTQLTETSIVQIVPPLVGG